jgi:hemerythrin
MKNIFEWSEAMSVNDPVLDGQHKEVISQLNGILDKLSGEINREDVKKFLDFMFEYISKHKAYEEDYMEKNNYPDLKWHKKEHEFFNKQYLAFRKSFDEGINPSVLIMEIEKYLGGWLFNHVMTADKKYADFMREKRLSKNDK